MTPYKINKVLRKKTCFDKSRKMYPLIDDDIPQAFTRVDGDTDI